MDLKTTKINMVWNFVQGFASYFLRKQFPLSKHKRKENL